jgi:hypothetical protein
VGQRKKHNVAGLCEAVKYMETDDRGQLFFQNAIPVGATVHGVGRGRRRFSAKHIPMME